MKIIIDDRSGFCFGVVYAIEKAESQLKKSKQLYCLGDIVHNNEEVKRLQNIGLKTITKEEFRKLRDTTVLIRAHGEPPETYKIAYENNIRLIDASCPVVLKLQNLVRVGYLEMKKKNGQVVIFGKPGHAEVIGLQGQTQNEAIIINGKEDLDKLDFSRPVYLYAQTTKSVDQFYEIVEIIKQRLDKDVDFVYHDTICRQVAFRDKELRNFCKDKDIILFISGKKSSNGRMLYEVCKKQNPNTKFISSVEEIDLSWFKGDETVGICGATSTPQWLMEKAKRFLEEKFRQD